MQVDNALVTPKKLFQCLSSDKLIILDASKQKVVSGSPEIFASGYITSALKFDLENTFRDCKSSQPNCMPSAELFTQEAQKLGINSDSIIVVYDARGIYSSPRAWWMFKTMGHEQVYVLNGGLQAWLEYGGAISDVLASKKRIGNFSPRLQKNTLSNSDQIKEAIQIRSKTDNIQIIDARSSERFQGLQKEPRAGLRSGHIPTSINIPFTDLVKSGKFIDTYDLESIFHQHKLNTDQQLICSCGSGITACIILLAAYSLGFRQLSLYDGSWTEWGSDKRLPILTANS